MARADAIASGSDPSYDTVLDRSDIDEAIRAEIFHWVEFD
tara:strand:+ start:777 stop:896 length:120 start_codon:yes stop_codon:yes gene_type:complete